MIKRIVTSIIILQLMFIIMGITDYRRTTQSFEKPIFARLDISTAKKDGGSGKYNGIGYSIDIEGNFMPEDELKGVTHTRFYVFGREICYAKRD